MNINTKCPKQFELVLKKRRAASAQPSLKKQELLRKQAVDEAYRNLRLMFEALNNIQTQVDQSVPSTFK